MAFAAPLLPYLAAAGTVVQGVSQKNAADRNAQIYGFEAASAASQGYQAEAVQRREGTAAIGREVTAAGQAGAGYEGSAGRSISQSAVNAEMDDLNVRYKAGLQRWGYGTQGQNIKAEGNDAARASVLRAGASLLRGFSSSYAGQVDLGDNYDASPRPGTRTRL